MPATKRHHPQQPKSRKHGKHAKAATGTQPQSPTHPPTTAGSGSSGGSTSKKITGTVTPEQVAIAMVVNGFPRNPKVIGSGIATVRGESGFNGEPHGGDVPGGCCHGFWEINQDNSDYPGEDCARDLMCSTQYAHKLWVAAGNCFACQPGPNPWQGGTDSGGTAADQAVAKKVLAMSNDEMLQALGVSSDIAGPGTGIPGVDEVAGAASAIPDILKQIVAFISRLFEPSFWVRVGKAILGSVCIVMGTMILGKAILGIDIGGGGEAIARALRRSDSDQDDPATRAYQTAKARESGRQAAKDESRQRFFDTVNKDKPPF